MYLKVFLFEKECLPFFINTIWVLNFIRKMFWIINWLNWNRITTQLHTTYTLCFERSVTIFYLIRVSGVNRYNFWRFFSSRASNIPCLAQRKITNWPKPNPVQSICINFNLNKQILTRTVSISFVIFLFCVLFSLDRAFSVWIRSNAHGSHELNFKTFKTHAKCICICYCSYCAIRFCHF